MRRRLHSLLLTPGTIPPFQVLVHGQRVLIVRYGRRWLIETRTRIVAGNSIWQMLRHFFTSKTSHI
ncbi:MAG: hypothetical protein M0Z66_07555 [Thermaerobacter sp.]|nr:hypothetical protein [Thermaerobacter sp.]